MALNWNEDAAINIGKFKNGTIAMKRNKEMHKIWEDK